MFGISYGGISQLFTARTQPPSLAAITPLSVIDGPQTTLYPGGILNTGFALNWARERMAESHPADPDDPNNGASPGPSSGSRKATRTARTTRSFTPRPRTWSRGSARPTTTSQRSSTRSPRSPSWTRSTSRPSWPASGPTSRPAATARPSRGRCSPARIGQEMVHVHERHPRRLALPEVYNRLYDFLEIYVDQEDPIIKSAAVRASFPAAFQAIFGIDGPVRGCGAATRRPAAARPDPAAAELRTRQGGVGGAAADPRPLRQRRPADRNAGWPYPGFEQSFDELPGSGHHRPGLVHGPRRRARAPADR